MVKSRVAFAAFQLNTTCLSMASTSESAGIFAEKSVGNGMSVSLAMESIDSLISSGETPAERASASSSMSLWSRTTIWKYCIHVPAKGVFWRRDGDLNSGGKIPHDFQSCAIPGYATSALPHGGGDEV